MGLKKFSKSLEAEVIPAVTVNAWCNNYRNRSSGLEGRYVHVMTEIAQQRDRKLTHCEYVRAIYRLGMVLTGKDQGTDIRVNQSACLNTRWTCASLCIVIPDHEVLNAFWGRCA
ncbi:uncharacterized protein LOC122267788 [Penaeus japonicus]|uniref:uncharacterized protein LOC122267788 n=1 Tax=Penaeus japonicus TaxID=27405 RepID=UPI001C71762B|nr:uncharacterized protein LOC122267788 [Penaeus japonicus]